ncbi:MAG: ABC transporter permease [Methylotenera sp.]|nr:ABC transporter permease [Oligoflexia bacterium]
MKSRERIFRFIQPVVAILFGLAIGLLITLYAGENPWHVLKILANSAFGSVENIGMTLFYATPLIFTGLSVAIGFHAGLFNIGAEGQLAFGALAAAAVGILYPNVPGPLAPVLATLAAFAAGAVWGYIPGWLRARRGAHEVINTIMLNFVAAGLTSWITLYLLKSTESQNPETRTIAPAYLISHFAFFGDTPFNPSFLLALVAAFALWVLLWKTVLGYEMRAVGQNELAARAAGIDSAKMRIIALTLAGGLAGFVGVGEVLGHSHKFEIGFSPGYGFMGIAVALLGRNRPLGIIGAAILFGALHKGSLDLDMETEKVTRDLSLILQALIILAVSADGFWERVRKAVL